MVMASALTMFWANAEDAEDHCLPGGKHKANPSAEEELGVCQIYAESKYSFSTEACRIMWWGEIMRIL